MESQRSKFGNHYHAGARDHFEKAAAAAPDYAPAREYYGQTLLAKGDREGAEIQLMWLKRLKADDLVKQLETAMAEAAPAESAGTATDPLADPPGRSTAKPDQ